LITLWSRLPGSAARRGAGAPSEPAAFGPLSLCSPSGTYRIAALCLLTTGIKSTRQRQANRSMAGPETMEADYFIGVAQQSLWILALASAPLLLPVLVIGVLLGMVQAATSINEQTLTFVPKLIVAAICLAIFGGSILVLLTDFTRELFAQIPALVR
jgi:flagellar biosynthetic protein FliQ